MPPKNENAVDGVSDLKVLSVYLNRLLPDRLKPGNVPSSSAFNGLSTLFPAAQTLTEHAVKYRSDPDVFQTRLINPHLWDPARSTSTHVSTQSVRSSILANIKPAVLRRSDAWPTLPMYKAVPIIRLE